MRARRRWTGLGGGVGGYQLELVQNGLEAGGRELVSVQNTSVLHCERRTNIRQVSTEAVVGPEPPARIKKSHQHA